MATSCMLASYTAFMKPSGLFNVGCVCELRARGVCVCGMCVWYVCVVCVYSVYVYI